MPLELLDKLPESIRNLLQSGTYTLYKSKESKKVFFVEVRHGFGFLVNDCGKILEEKTLDEDHFEQIIHYVLPKVKKKSA